MGPEISLIPSCSTPLEQISEKPSLKEEDSPYNNASEELCSIGAAEEEEPPVLKPEVYITKTETPEVEQEPLVVEACGSNTFILSTKARKRLSSSGMDTSSESTPTLHPETKVVRKRECAPNLLPSGSQFFLNPPQKNFMFNSDYTELVTSSSFLGNNEGTKMRSNRSLSYDVLQDGVVSKVNYVPAFHLYRESVSNGFVMSNTNNNQNVGHVYCAEEDLDVPGNSNEFVCPSNVHHQDPISASTSFSLVL